MEIQTPNGLGFGKANKSVLSRGVKSSTLLRSVLDRKRLRAASQRSPVLRLAPGFFPLRFQAPICR
jgi:hypothetical protein